MSLIDSEDLADDLRKQAIRGLKAARNAVLLDDLVAVVQCDYGKPGDWRTIAAFDLMNVAEAFADQYREAAVGPVKVMFRVARLSK